MVRAWKYKDKIVAKLNVYYIVTNQSSKTKLLKFRDMGPKGDF